MPVLEDTRVDSPPPPGGTSRRGLFRFLASGDGWPYVAAKNNTWFEGLMLLALYVVLAAAFFLA